MLLHQSNPSFVAATLLFLYFFLPNLNRAATCMDGRKDRIRWIYGPLPPLPLTILLMASQGRLLLHTEYENDCHSMDRSVTVSYRSTLLQNSCTLCGSKSLHVNKFLHLQLYLLLKKVAAQRPVELYNLFEKVLRVMILLECSCNCLSLVPLNSDEASAGITIWLLTQPYAS